MAALAAAATAVAMLQPAGTAQAAAATYVNDPASLVNPFIGTTNGGNTFPGADAPFGMLQWSPDTARRTPGGGYYYGNSEITGFSLTHLSGPGCDAAGDVPILPTIGQVSASATDAFSHTNESAHAGYYSVKLDNGVGVQLTTTTRTGMAQLAFPPTTQANLVFKLSGSQKGDSASSFKAVSSSEVQGSVTSRNFCGTTTPYTLYFDMVFDHPFTTSGTYANPSGAYVTFDTTANPLVLAKVGISYVSVANAKANLQAENPGWDFSAVEGATHAAWNNLLERIQVGGGTAQQQTVFYTALYHALLHPNVFSDVNGQYMGADGKVHTVDPGHSAFYTNFSGWDIYRAQAQLEAVVDPSVASDTAQSMLDDYSQDHMLPKWVENNGETYIMVGDPADSIIADYYAFGARNFDTATALNDMVAEATQTNNIRPGLNYLDNPGYLPLNGHYGCCHFYGAVSTQLEYDTADAALSQYAAALGDSSVAQAMAARSQDWQNVFNPANGFIQPKLTSGQFAGGFDPTGGTGFVEGDSYQYTLMVPFDLTGLRNAMGGPAKLASYLHSFFTQVDGARKSPYAAMSNEPSIETPWEYDYAGQPYNTQQVVRRIQDQLYTDTPGGLAGNDDLGTMSAWYVWSALGGYPETPGSADLALGSPLFPNIAIHLANGKAITETAPAASDSNPYVQSLTMNGSTYQKAYLPGRLFTHGGTLDWTLGSQPNTAWAAAPGDVPPSITSGLLPALGYMTGVAGSNAIVAPGGSTTVTLGVQSTSRAAQHIAWSTAAASGSPLQITPSSGEISVASEARATQPVSIHIPANAPDGIYNLSFSLRTQTGVRLPDVVTQVAVAAPGDLRPFFDNVGISPNSDPSCANYSGYNTSYSADALAAAGVIPGATVNSDGVNFTWPDVAPCTQDNVIAAGQTVSVKPLPGAGVLGFVGSSTNGHLSGPVLITYTDGTSSTATLTLNAWTRGPGGADVTFVAMPYRNGGGGPLMHTTYIYATKVPVDPGKTVASVTLPTVGGGNVAMHIFAIALGK